MQTWIATPMFKVKNRSMQKKAGIRTYCGSTTWFCEPWPVQPVHTIPLFQALNGTVGLSSLFFFSHTMLFGLMSIHVKQIETLKSSPHSLKFQSLFELSTSPSLLTLSITSLISASLPHHHRPPLFAQIAAHSLNHSLPLSHSASSPSLQVLLGKAIFHSSTSTDLLPISFRLCSCRYFILFNFFFLLCQFIFFGQFFSSYQATYHLGVVTNANLKFLVNFFFWCNYYPNWIVGFILLPRLDCWAHFYYVK